MTASGRIVAALNIRKLAPYMDAWKLQQALVAQRIAWQKEGRQGHDALLLLQHPSVYTLGRSAKVEDVRFSIDGGSQEFCVSMYVCTYVCMRSCAFVLLLQVHRIERGGQVTWHGPGQVVCYPILDLNYHKKDLRWYVRQLEEAVIQVLSIYGVEGQRDAEHTGVWVGDRKVAAIGVSASRWVTMHGLALNVDPDLSAYERIVPCGIKDRGVTSLKHVATAGPPVDDHQVRLQLLEAFTGLLPWARFHVTERDDLPKVATDVCGQGMPDEDNPDGGAHAPLREAAGDGER